MIVALYTLLLLATTLYSYVLVDPNLTLVNHPLWSYFREWAVDIGYHRRDVSWIMYLTVILFLFFFNRHFTTHFKKYDPLKIAGLISLVLLMSYPFLSHDFFNYLFDARILTYHHQNPYQFMALDFPTDPWIRFMHWTDRTYPYGPSWLFFSLVPSFLGIGKFLLNYLFFKSMFMLAYILAVYCLSKTNTRSAMIFATHPLILMEGLVNAHNDLVAVALAIYGVFLLNNDRQVLSRVLLLLSGGIKYTTLPLIFLAKPKKNDSAFFRSTTILALVGIVGVLYYLSFIREVQPWYFLTIFAFLPYFPNAILKLHIFFFGLLMSYYPYIALGGWTKPEYVQIKHSIILFFTMLTVLYILMHRTSDCLSDRPQDGRI